MAGTEALVETTLAAADLAGADALVAEAGWNQNAADWRIFLELGRAFAVKTADGAVAATAATLPYPSGFGWISMVLVAGAFRRRGIATRLLERCIRSLQEARMVPVLERAADGELVGLAPGGEVLARVVGLQALEPGERGARKALEPEK